MRVSLDVPELRTPDRRRNGGHPEGHGQIHQRMDHLSWTIDHQAHHLFWGWEIVETAAEEVGHVHGSLLSAVAGVEHHQTYWNILMKNGRQNEMNIHITNYIISNQNYETGNETWKKKKTGSLKIKSDAIYRTGTFIIS